jgi:hypothetical protein
MLAEFILDNTRRPIRAPSLVSLRFTWPIRALQIKYLGQPYAATCADYAAGYRAEAGSGLSRNESTQGTLRTAEGMSY